MTLDKLKGLEELNQLSFSEDEKSSVIKIFENMNENEKILGEYNTDNTDVMVHVMPMTNVLREDVRKQPFSRDDLLKGAPEHTEDSWQVPRLVK
ncbi:MAG: Asp-tRNA(Asn)/Glu-tRNA(Gln) amidotransferase subunit GatC [Clostridia bacterium]|nr:Asp-tRNA(Asn)/Glu-tRNA(Gln) amidotransferase subunit GatC [Clostridia bacterium]